MLCLGVNRKAGLRSVAFSTSKALVRGLLTSSLFAALPVNFFNVSLEAGLLRESPLAQWADEKRVLVLLLHVAIKSRLCGEHLVAMLAREALADVIMEAFNVRKEVVFLKKQFIAHKALEGLAVV